MTEREELVEAMAKLVFEAVNPTCSWSVYKGSRTKGEFCKGMSAALDEAVKRLLAEPSEVEKARMSHDFSRAASDGETSWWDNFCTSLGYMLTNRAARYSAVEDPAVDAVMAKIGGDRQWAAQVVAIVDRARGRGE